MKKLLVTQLILLAFYRCFAQDVPLKTYLGIGGEVRYQYFYFRNEDWGAAPKDYDGYVLTRYLAHADLYAGNNFRAFVQLQSSLASGKIATPSPVDNNPADLHQAFIDVYAGDQKGRSITFRLGRQELSYGSQRLISVREAPNNRQAFDGARLLYKGPKLKIDAFYSHYVQARPGIFDDVFYHGTRFWGGYGTLNKVPVLQNVDLYYLGLWKRSSVFDDGTGKETRHSAGARVWKISPGWNYDLEGVYQFGEVNASRISAWTISSNVSYTFNGTALAPQFGIKTEAISGDRQYDDNKMNTFNPLFPRGSYFGLAALIGPANLLDMHPYTEVALTPKLTLALDYDLFWRLSRNDGLYAVNGRLLYSGRGTDSKNVGRQLGAALEYLPNRFLNFKQELTWFNADDFLKETGSGKDILMFGSTITFKF